MELLGVADLGPEEAGRVLASFTEREAATRTFPLRPEQRREAWAGLFRLMRRHPGHMQVSRTLTRQPDEGKVRCNSYSVTA